MDFSHYESVPPNVQQQIVAQYKPKAEEEDESLKVTFACAMTCRSTNE
jgi:hypothetical protein